MSKQLFEALLAKFKKANNERKQKLSKTAGFNTVGEYKSYLENEINMSKNESKTTPKVETTPIIHVIDVIDCSASMQGAKIYTALEGINKGVKALQESTLDVKYLYTLCDFSYKHDINFKYLKSEINEVTNIRFSTRGSTALYDAINSTLVKLSNTPSNEKVLINIYTDGYDNDSTMHVDTLKKIIKELSENYTVTFIGTKVDTDFIISRLNIDETNTLSYDGSSEGLKATLNATVNSRMVYTQSVINNEDVSKGFYKNLKK